MLCMEAEEVLSVLRSMRHGLIQKNLSLFSGAWKLEDSLEMTEWICRLGPAPLQQGSMGPCQQGTGYLIPVSLQEMVQR